MPAPATQTSARASSRRGSRQRLASVDIQTETVAPESLVIGMPSGAGSRPPTAPGRGYGGGPAPAIGRAAYSPGRPAALGRHRLRPRAEGADRDLRVAGA